MGFLDRRLWKVRGEFQFLFYRIVKCDVSFVSENIL